jgi:hypothetical protein
MNEAKIRSRARSLAGRLLILTPLLLLALVGQALAAQPMLAAGYLHSLGLKSEQEPTMKSMKNGIERTFSWHRLQFLHALHVLHGE